MVMIFTMLSCGSRSTVKSAQITTPSHKNYSYKVVNKYPHSTDAYTQGLFFHDGTIYEGTGLNGRSSISIKELGSGKRLNNRNLEQEYFGEGIALHQNKIYQLTWQSGKAFVYEPIGLELLSTRTYTGEGWGITSDGEKLYMSDGSDKIYTVNPDTFEKLSSIDVQLDKRAVTMLNELEWIDGAIWANVYGSESIVIIDPSSGEVTAVINLEGLLPVSERTETTDVLNGIAYDKAGKRIFVTGKNWPHIYQIELVEI